MASSSSNPGDEFEFRHLLDAAFIGDLPAFKKQVQEIQSLGYKIELIKDEKRRVTAFRLAARAGRTQICRYLVEEVKIDVDLKDVDGRTLLHSASRGGKFQTALYLLEKGANPNTKSYVMRTSLHYAAKNGSTKLVQLLIQRGANVNAVADIGTPLVLAAFRGHKDVVKLLLENGAADVNMISYTLNSPLLTAVHTSSIECVQLLLEAGADPNLYGSKRFIPLAEAACQEKAEIITCLLKFGADPNMTNAKGLTPIEVAASDNFHQDNLYQRVMILFPETSPIPTIPEWSVSGIIKHACSAEATIKTKEKMNEHFLMLKSKGEEAFNKKDYYGAIKCYTEAYYCNPTDTTILSNRSLCWARLNEGGIALREARACVMLTLKWPKAYYRNYGKAVYAFYSAWMLEPQNKEIERALREADICHRETVLCAYMNRNI